MENNDNTSLLQLGTVGTATLMCSSTIVVNTEGWKDSPTEDNGKDTSESDGGEAGQSINEGHQQRDSPVLAQWVEELRWRAELETMSVLYAKSVLPMLGGETGSLKNATTIGTTRVPLRFRATEKDVSCKLTRRPLTTGTEPISASLPRVNRSPVQAHSSSSSLRHRSTVCLMPSSTMVMHRQSVVMMPPAEIEEQEQQLGTLTKFARSLPNEASLRERLDIEGHDFENGMDYAKLPLCKQPIYQPDIRYRRRENRPTVPASAKNRRKAYESSCKIICPAAFRHSIRVNNECETENDDGGGKEPKNKLPTQKTKIAAASPSSTDESSMDSGQCSESSPHHLHNSSIVMPYRQTAALSAGSSAVDDEESKAPVLRIQQLCRSLPLMPSYARTANSIGQVLRLSSALYAQLQSFSLGKMEQSSATPISKGNEQLLKHTHAYIRLVKQCPCATQMPKAELELAERAVHDMEQAMTSNNGQQVPKDYLVVCVRRMLGQTLLVFVQVLCQYLSECTNLDRLLPIALEQLIHLLLFGDELCLEAVRHSAMENLLAMVTMPLTGQSTLVLLLRAMAVLCGTAKGCLQLISIGGLDSVVQVLGRDDVQEECSVEAAGCLAQLCAPARCFVLLSLQSLRPLVLRLLQLLDCSSSPEAQLLCLAALANLSAQNQAAVTELLYIHNAVPRMIKATQREQCTGNLFIQEELVTILTRMANCGYERALLAQGAIPLLCRLLRRMDRGNALLAPQSGESEQRIAYKAAVCLGTLASSGAGLRALHEQGVHKRLTDAFNSEIVHRSATTAPAMMICQSIRQKLETTYHLETAV